MYFTQKILIIIIVDVENFSRSKKKRRGGRGIISLQN